MAYQAYPQQLGGYKIGSYTDDIQPNALAEQYMDEIVFATQQTRGKLVDFVTPLPVDYGTMEKLIPIWPELDGTTGQYDSISSGVISALADNSGADWNEIVSRYQETINEYHEFNFRRVTTNAWYRSPFIERKDLALLNGGVQQGIVTSVVNSYFRKKDDIIIEALDASVSAVTRNATTGAKTESEVAFPSTQIIDPDGSERMTDEKLEDSYVLFQENEVDIAEELPVLVIGPKQVKDLKTQEHQINFDYVSNRAKEQINFGHLPNGIPVVVSNRLGTDATTGARNCYLYQPSGIIHMIEDDLFRQFDQLPSKRYGFQFYFEHSSGAVRVQEERVIKILCDETPTA